MKTNDSIQKFAQDLPVDPRLAEEIKRAVEAMQRVKIARAAEAVKPVPVTSGNTYVLPEPLVFRVSGSSERD